MGLEKWVFFFILINQASTTYEFSSSSYRRWKFWMYLRLALYCTKVNVYHRFRGYSNIKTLKLVQISSTHYKYKIIKSEPREKSNNHQKDSYPIISLRGDQGFSIHTIEKIHAWRVSTFRKIQNLSIKMN